MSMYYKYVIPTYMNKSIQKNNCLRFNMAKTQHQLEVIPVEKIIEYVEYFLKELGITHQTPIYWDLIQKPLRRGFYSQIWKDNPGMKDKRDIVWIKFTQKGHVGVVASGTDINFDMTNTSGKIIQSVNEVWNKTFVLLIPLENMSDGWNRQMAESAIGNYLIEQGVPILDYYSHNI